jgi:hypothetical protein
MRAERTTTSTALTGLGLLALLVGLAPARAMAKDVCVRSSDGDAYVFSRVSTLRPGRVVPLTGIRVAPFPPARPVAPVTGAAVMRSDGTIHVGVVVHTMSPSLNQPSSSFLVSVDVNTAFAGTGTLDGTGNFRPTGSITWTSADCASIPIP